MKTVKWFGKIVGFSDMEVELAIDCVVLGSYHVKNAQPKLESFNELVMSDSSRVKHVTYLITYLTHY